MPYIFSLPSSVSFTGQGLLGYSFGPLNQKDLDVYYIEVEKGHDTFMISKKIIRTYYVLSGNGHFTIGDHRYAVSPGVLVEVPPKVEYCYSGKMTLLGFARPRWFSGNDTYTKWNPDVVGRDSPCEADAEPWLARVVRSSVFGKSPVSAYLRINQQLWNIFPSTVTAFRFMRSYGAFLHKLACIQGVRAQAFSTCFLRNRPELELIRRLLERTPKGHELRVTVLGCSTGAEAYSVAWRIRSARPDVKLILQAVDISKQAIEVGKRGVYSLTNSELSSTRICDGMTAAEMEELFHRDGDLVTVKAWIREGINWRVRDVGDPDIIRLIEPQDVVVANNFLCHMNTTEAESCLRNIAHLVKGNGYLFVSGIDLDVRTKVASDLGWKPLLELLEEIHEGDPYLRRYWPCQYGGLEPLDKRRPDWSVRYASVFQVGSRINASPARHEEEEVRNWQRSPEQVAALSERDLRGGE